VKQFPVIGFQFPEKQQQFFAFSGNWQLETGN
jgi:hypothetical protein